MLDHIILTVSDLTRSVEFYERALAPLGIRTTLITMVRTGTQISRGFGRDSQAFFWLKAGEPSAAAVHFGFAAESRDAVDAFYAAAMAAGARDNISPHVRSEYHDMYYAADVLDQDGYSVEAVIKK